MGVFVIVFYFLFPGLLLYFSTRYPLINKIGIVVLCYAGGLVLGNTGAIPDSISGLQGNVMGISILLGIPLVLFSENVVRWAKMARVTFLSLLLGVVSVVIMVLVGYLIYRHRIPEIWQVSGMMIGVYTGGTPNLAAIAQALGVDEALYIMTHTAELVIGAIILLFLLTGAKPVFGLFLKPYRSSGAEQPDIDVSDFESYTSFFSRSTLPGILKSFGVAVLIVGSSFGLSTLFEGETSDTVAILGVTTLGILASLIPAVNRIKSSFQLGMYFIYVFCVIVASKANLAVLLNVDNAELLINLLTYIALVIVGSLILHGLLSKVFGVNVDEFIITSTALSNSPPFVPVVAAALKNKEVVVPGMIIGVIGYAIGNYLGVAIAYLLK